MKNTNQYYINCLVSLYGFQISPNEAGCELRIEGRRMVIDYISTTKARYLWRCEEVAPGHYTCRNEGTHPGQATLHVSPGERIYEGYYKIQVDGGFIDGMWRITLGELIRTPKKGELARVPKKGDTILINSEDCGWVECKITEVKGDHIGTDEYEYVLFSDFSKEWKYPKKR